MELIIFLILFSSLDVENIAISKFSFFGSLTSKDWSILKLIFKIFFSEMLLNSSRSNDLFSAKTINPNPFCKI